MPSLRKVTGTARTPSKVERRAWARTNNCKPCYAGPCTTRRPLRKVDRWRRLQRLAVRQHPDGAKGSRDNPDAPHVRHRLPNHAQRRQRGTTAGPAPLSHCSGRNRKQRRCPSRDLTSLGSRSTSSRWERSPSSSVLTPPRAPTLPRRASRDRSATAPRPPTRSSRTSRNPTAPRSSASILPAAACPPSPASRRCAAAALAAVPPSDRRPCPAHQGRSAASRGPCG